MNKNHIIIDCSGLSYASMYAYGTLSHMGKPTGVIFGFLSKILKIAKKFQTNKFYFCWDSNKELSLRKEIYPNYKIKRNDKLLSSEEITDRKLKDQQVVLLHEKILPELGFHNHFYCMGYEADDFLMYVSKRLNAKYHTKNILMLTNDNDMLQALDYCCIIDMKDLKPFTSEDMYKKFSIYPKQWAFAKAIGGCSSDCVEGICGISDPKSPSSNALKFINGKLKKGKKYEAIISREGQDIINRNMRLVELPFFQHTPSVIFRRNKFSKEKFVRIFDKYNFRSFLEPKKFKEWEEIFLNGK